MSPLVSESLEGIEGVPIFTLKVIDGDSRIGTRFETIDIDKDELLDTFVSIKKGAHLLTEVR